MKIKKALVVYLIVLFNSEFQSSDDKQSNSKNREKHSWAKIERRKTTATKDNKGSKWLFNNSPCNINSINKVSKELFKTSKEKEDFLSEKKAKNIEKIKLIVT